MAERLGRVEPRCQRAGTHTDAAMRTSAATAAAAVRSGGANWFRTYGTPLIAGRDFSSTDTAGALPVAIVPDDLINHPFELFRRL